MTTNVSPILVIVVVVVVFVVAVVVVAVVFVEDEKLQNVFKGIAPVPIF